jgi:hypothetical protein
VQPQYDFSIENFTEVFDTIHKRNVSSFQCNASLDYSPAMREINVPKFIFIDFYIPAYNKNKIIRDLYGGINEFKKGYQPIINNLKYENGYTYGWAISART